jgi:hypothetical protein
MQIKSYENPWIPTAKGVFFILFGIMALLQTGTFETLSVFFVILIFLIAILFLVVAFLVKESTHKPWLIASGLINLGFGIWLASQYGGSKDYLGWIIAIWIVWSMLSDFVEAILLFRSKNALGALYIITGILTLFFAYSVIVVFSDITPQRLDFLGVMAFVVGLVSELAAYLFAKSRDYAEG